SRNPFLRATRGERKSEIMQINGKKEKRLGPREKTMAAKCVDLNCQSERGCQLKRREKWQIARSKTQSQ
ncbi:unnamed protein product, partial [Porites lobata]